MTKEEFKKTRLELDLTQEKLAEKLFITTVQVNNLERGRSNITRRVESHFLLLSEHIKNALKKEKEKTIISGSSDTTGYIYNI